MNDNVIDLRPNLNIPTALRNIAEEIEQKNIPATSCTLVIGSVVYHLGCVIDGDAAAHAVFNLTYGIQKLMKPAVDSDGS